MSASESHKIVTTKDGSHTLFNEQISEHYHSTFGAIQESAHIFIQGALDRFRDKQSRVNILEIGFGTGLNALLTMCWADKNSRKIHYHALEAYPISKKIAGSLNYFEKLHIDQDLFLKFHQPADVPFIISDNFTLEKEINTLENVSFQKAKYNVIYFDAFSPDVQPELWSTDIFQKLFSAMKEGGILTTYSCKGIVKRAMKAAGFQIEKLPGPPGKREFLRGIKK